MSEYLTITREIIAHANTVENSLPIRNDSCRSKFFFHPNITSKVCLFFHGFTAAPYQFEPLAEVLFKAGYNVLIPLLPGHGIAGDWDRDNPPPLPVHRKVYERFALSWLEVAKKLGNEVIVGGLSGGATLAAWLAIERRQEIKKALLFACYLSSNKFILDLFVKILPVYFEWQNKDNREPIGYPGFRIPELRVFLDMGKEILDRVQNEDTAPMLLIYSESDEGVDQNELKFLFKATVRQEPKCWQYVFDKIFEVPHTMMTIKEGNQYEGLLVAIAHAYIDSDITWDELREIGYEILQGNSFNTAVDSLNLTGKVSSNIAILLTAMENKTIIDGW
jgi:esterase/lipase